MRKISISKNGDYFESEGKKFFYFADTAWAAIPRATPDEWIEYLDYRRTQGFNAIQLNLLPVMHDMSCSESNIYPFKLQDDGIMDFHSINVSYFDKAFKMMEEACKKEFVPILAPLWCNYVEDSWASQRLPRSVMPIDMVEEYMRYVVKRFESLKPIYIISGDTLFETEKVCRYYHTEMKVLKELSPSALATIHLKPDADLPDEFMNSPLLDFYMYQSGHSIEEQNLSYDSAEKFYNASVKRPIINGEPCYEGLSFGFKYGRFKAFDVRKAMWQSILGGAKAGITYGAHGVWNWHREGDSYNGSEFAGKPYDWRTAMNFQGAWDAGFLKYIFENYDMFDIEPLQKILNNTKEIRMAATNNLSKIVIYSPYNVDIKIEMNLVDYSFIMIDLEKRNVGLPQIAVGKETSVINMNRFNADTLYIGFKNTVTRFE